MTGCPSLGPPRPLAPPGPARRRTARRRDRRPVLGGGGRDPRRGPGGGELVYGARGRVRERRRGRGDGDDAVDIGRRGVRRRRVCRRPDRHRDQRDDGSDLVAGRPGSACRRISPPLPTTPAPTLVTDDGWVSLVHGDGGVDAVSALPGTGFGALAAVANGPSIVVVPSAVSPSAIYRVNVGAGTISPIPLATSRSRGCCVLPPSAPRSRAPVS